MKLKLLGIATIISAVGLTTIVKAEEPSHVRRLLDTNSCPGCDLSYANLRGANLRDADLRSADLQGADLRDADLRGADLRGADIRNIVTNSGTRMK